MAVILFTEADTELFELIKAANVDVSTACPL